MYEQSFFSNNFMIDLPVCLNSWFMCSNLHSISFQCLYKILMASEWSTLPFFIMEYKPCSLHFNEGYENLGLNIISDYSTFIETDQKKYLTFTSRLQFKSKCRRKTGPFLKMQYQHIKRSIHFVNDFEMLEKGTLLMCERYENPCCTRI